MWNEYPDPKFTILKYIGAFTAGDGEGMAALFSAPSSIDGMAPHVWLGPTLAIEWILRRSDRAGVR